MAAASIIVDLVAKTGLFETDMKKAEKSLNNFGNQFKKVQNALTGLASAIGVGAIGVFAKQTIDAADNLQLLSERTGVSVKDLASLELSAKQSGASIDSVARSMLRFQRSLGEAQNGSKEVAEALKRLGITTKDPKEGMIQIAAAIENSTNKTKTLADVSKILGRSYIELLPLLKQGSEEIRKQTEASAQYADIMAKFAPQADKFNDQLDATAQAAKAVVSTFLLQSGALDKLSKAVKFVADNMQLLEKAAKYALQAIVLLYSAKVISGLTSLVGKLNRVNLMLIGVGAVAVIAQEAMSKINGDEVTNTVKEIAKAQEMIDQTLRRFKGLANSDAAKYGWIDISQQAKNAESAVLEYQAAIESGREKLKKLLGVTDEVAESIGEVDDLKIDIVDEAAKKKLEEYSNKLGQIFDEIKGLNPEEKTNIQLLQEKVDALTATSASLDKANQKYVEYANSMLQAARAAESLKAFEEAMNRGRDNELEVSVDTTNEEMQRMKELDEAYQQMYEELKKANEDLNVAIIMDDKKRIQAQIELEHQRRIDTINSLILENDERERLLEMENERYQKSVDLAEQSSNQMTEFWKQAARNMQDAMGNLFFDAMQGRLSDLAGSFKATIDRMVANLLASQLLKYLTGDFGTTGVMGGVIGNIFSGFGGARANGGSVMAGTPYLVGERGAEMFIPDRSGMIVSAEKTRAMGGMNVVNNFHVSGQMDTRTQSQVAAAAYSGITRAARRNL